MRFKPHLREKERVLGNDSACFCVYNVLFPCCDNIAVLLLLSLTAMFAKLAIARSVIQPQVNCTKLDEIIPL